MAPGAPSPELWSEHPEYRLRGILRSASRPQGDPARRGWTISASAPANGPLDLSLAPPLPRSRSPGRCPSSPRVSLCLWIFKETPLHRLRLPRLEGRCRPTPTLLRPRRFDGLDGLLRCTRRCVSSDRRLLSALAPHSLRSWGSSRFKFCRGHPRLPLPGSPCSGPSEVFPRRPPCHVTATPAFSPFSPPHPRCLHRG